MVGVHAARTRSPGDCAIGARQAQPLAAPGSTPQRFAPTFTSTSTSSVDSCRARRLREVLRRCRLSSTHTLYARLTRVALSLASFWCSDHFVGYQRRRQRRRCTSASASADLLATHADCPTRDLSQRDLRALVRLGVGPHADAGAAQRLRSAASRLLLEGVEVEQTGQACRPVRRAIPTAAGGGSGDDRVTRACRGSFIGVSCDKKGALRQHADPKHNGSAQACEQARQRVRLGSSVIAGSGHCGERVAERRMERVEDRPAGASRVRGLDSEGRRQSRTASRGKWLKYVSECSELALVFRQLSSRRWLLSLAAVPSGTTSPTRRASSRDEALAELSTARTLRFALDGVDGLGAAR